VGADGLAVLERIRDHEVTIDFKDTVAELVRLDKLIADAEAASSVLTRREASGVKTAGDVGKLGNALAKVKDMRGPVLSSAAARAGAAATVAVLQERLESEKTKAKTGGGCDVATIKPWCDAVEIVGTLAPPLETAQLDLAGAEGEDAREVLDRLVAALRYRHLRAVEGGGTNSSKAQYLQQAIKTANDYRSGMALIFPASLYLKSSYPAAALQGDPGLEWRNELARGAIKSVPLIGGAWTRHLNKGDVSGKALSQIDRQFWQNINSVRVSGAGRTNYVMVQDDIGNWYVKGYSADPQDIIKSAKGLGQFALGGKLGTDLLNRPAPGEGEAPARQPTALEAVFEKHQNAYLEATHDTFETMKGRLETGLVAAIEGAWEGDKRTKLAHAGATAEINGAKERQLDPLVSLLKEDKGKSADSAQVAQRPGHIAAAIRAMDRFRNDLLTSIRRKVTADDESKTLAAGRKALAEKEAEEKELEAEVEELEAKCTATKVKDRDEDQNCDKLEKEEENLESLGDVIKAQKASVAESETAFKAKTAAIAALIEDADAVAANEIERHLTRREATVRAYENAITFTGDVVAE